MIKPIPPKSISWLRQSAALNGAVVPQVLLSILERLDVLEAAQQQALPTAEKSSEFAPTPEAAPVATDQELADCYADAAKVAIRNHRDFDKALTQADVNKARIRALYDLGRQHGAVDARCPHHRSSDKGTSYCALAEQTTAAQPAGGLAARSLLEQVAAMSDRLGAHTVDEIVTLSGRAAAWLRDNPPGQPVAIEPRGCPTPVASQPAPPAAFTWGLVERVAGAIWKTCDLEIEARAAIREVGEWADQRGLVNLAHLLREEASR